MIGNQSKYCSKCADKNRNNARKIPGMFVGVDCESKVMPDGIQRMIAFSLGREDGTGASLLAAPGQALTALSVVQWLFANVNGTHTDAAGKVWAQVPIGFGFNHDAALILKEFTQGLQICYSCRSRKEDHNQLCGTEHKDGETACERVHKFDPKAAQIVMSSGGEGALVALHRGTGYAFSHTPRRRLYIEHRPAGDRMDGNRRVDIHDVGSTFLGSLERNIDKWKPELADDARELIAWGKQFRKGWPADTDPVKIGAYSEMECVALSRMARQLIDKVREACQIPLPPSKLFGSGSLATAAFRAYKVPKRDQLHDAYTQDGFDGLVVNDLARLDYFGGKIEGPVLGLLTDPVGEVDIASAYPSQMVKLPCMQADHGHWQRVRNRLNCEEIPRGSVGHIRVRWAIDPTQITPFLIRRKDGRVAAPLNGESISALPEYFAAIDRFGGTHVQGIVATYWVQTCDCENPYGWMLKLYNNRLKIKEQLRALEALGRKDSDEYRALDAMQEAIKLVLNSGYGKLAQTRPVGAYTNLTFAAHITSATRAQLNIEAWAQEDRGGTIVYMHTDSVKSVNGSPIDGGTALGAWELTKNPILKFLIAQPGLAISMDTGYGATRGMSAASFRAGLETWLQTADLTQPPVTWPPIKVARTMMLNRKAAIARNAPEMAGNFIDSPLEVGFVSDKRAVFDAYPLPGNENAWVLPPQLYIHDQATLADLILWRTDLDKWLEKQADEID